MKEPCSCGEYILNNSLNIKLVNEFVVINVIYIVLLSVPFWAHGGMVTYTTISDETDNNPLRIAVYLNFLTIRIVQVVSSSDTPKASQIPISPKNRGMMRKLGTRYRKPRMSE